MLGSLYKRLAVNHLFIYLNVFLIVFVLALSCAPYLLFRLNSYASNFFIAAQNFSLASGFGSLSFFKVMLIFSSIPLYIYIVSRLRMPPKHRIFIIASIALYPFAELARFSLPALILFSYYLSSHLKAIPLRPTRFLIFAIIVAIYYKSINAFTVDSTNFQSGWIENTYFRGYNNAYDLDKFYHAN
jgi:hypothetical protein